MELLRILQVIYTFILIGSFGITLQAQPCDANGAGVYLYKQSEVDNFAAFHPNCDRIDGDLRIGEEVENLRGLSQITYIGGALQVGDNDKLVNLVGLENVVEIGGSVSLDGVDRLKNLRGLDNLSIVRGGLYLSDLPELDNLLGLDGLDSIMTEIRMTNLTKATTMVALATAQYIGGDVTINNCAFQTLSGFAGVQRFYGNVTLIGNSNLDSLKGLERLAEIKGDFILKMNDDLVLLGRPRNRMGLYNLDKIGGDLKIEECASLGTLLGLNALQVIDGKLWLKENASLLNIEALSKVNRIGDQILVTKCDKLSDFDGLHNLKKAYAISVIQNQNISSFYGLHNIVEVEENLHIGTNPSLSVISGGLIPGGGGSHRFLELKYIGGHLDISEASTVSMLGFYKVDTIGGNLALSTTMFGIRDFRNLTRVTGTLFLGNNFNLTEIDFDSLDYVGGILLEDNPRLGSFFGMSELEHIGEGGLYIKDNNGSLRNFYGLEKLKIIDGDLRLNQSEIIDFTGWNNAGGLSSLDSIGGSVIATNNIRLRSFLGLSALRVIGGHFRVLSNPDLIGIGGLYNLERLDSTLEISHHRFLQSLSGLDNVDYERITGLTITGNNALSQCEIESVCNYVYYSSGPKNIGGNLEGCNSVAEVIEACNAVGTDDFSKLSEIELIPNPTTSDLRLSHEEDLQMEYVITNTLQQTLKRGFINTNRILNTSDLQKGVYFLHAKWGSQTKILTFVKQ